MSKGHRNQLKELPMLKSGYIQMIEYIHKLETIDRPHVFCFFFKKKLKIIDCIHYSCFNDVEQDSPLLGYGPHVMTFLHGAQCGRRGKIFQWRNPRNIPQPGAQN